MYRKIALLLLFITLVILGAGIYVFITKRTFDTNQSAIEQPIINDQVVEVVEVVDQDNQQVEDVTTELTQPELSVRPARSKEQLERIINTEIKIKANKIVEESLGRHYTDDELSFIGNPRKNIIENMMSQGELTAEEYSILNN